MLFSTCQCKYSYALTAGVNVLTAKTEKCPHALLSLESAKGFGLVTSTIVDYIERRAYVLARGQYCIPETTEEKVPASSLFDTIAGSETGALIAANLLLPECLDEDYSTTSLTTSPSYDDDIAQCNTNARWASATSNWFKDEDNTLYLKDTLPVTWMFFCSLFTALILAYIGYKVTDRMFESYQYDQILLHFHEIIRYKKKIVKDRYNQLYDADALEAKIQTITNEIADKKG